jgi:hypothetical protein
MARNLKNFNHWIAELRQLAKDFPVVDLEDDGSTHLISKVGIERIFNKQSFGDEFRDGLTPAEAFENEMDAWRDAI